MTEQEITDELTRMAERYKMDEARRRIRMVEQPQNAGNAQAIPETPASGPDLDEYAYAGSPSPPVTSYEAQFRPKLSTEQGQGPYPPLQAGPWLDARTAPLVPRGYTYGDDQITRDPNGVPATVQYPSRKDLAWEALSGVVPTVGSAAAIGGAKAAGNVGHYAQSALDMVKDYRDSVGREVKRRQEPPDQSVPEIPASRSHGGSVVSGAIEGLRQFYEHPGNVYKGKADPYDPSQAFNFATTMMAGGVGGVPRQAGEVALGSGPIKPIRAYHGSPHDFDRFDLSKIGTGEGAQAYGHGLYFAEKEGVAKGYRESLSNPQLFVGDQKVGEVGALAGNDRANAAHALLLNNKSPEAAKEYVMRSMERAKSGNYGMGRQEGERVLKAIDEIAGLPVESRPGGRMYEVAIHADPERFLDWDKPLAGQHPEVRDKLTSTFGETTTMLPTTVTQGKNGRWYTMTDEGRVVGRYEGWPEKTAANEALKITREQAIPNYTVGEWHNKMNSPFTASEKLREAGIPGIKYLDQGSRAAGNGSRNYVLFDDKIVEILKKYGVASIAALPPAVQAAIQMSRPSPEREKANF
jgi:hypothetical protein